MCAPILPSPMKPIDDIIFSISGVGARSKPRVCLVRVAQRTGRVSLNGMDTSEDNVRSHTCSERAFRGGMRVFTQICSEFSGCVARFVGGLCEACSVPSRGNQLSTDRQ